MEIKYKLAQKDNKPVKKTILQRSNSVNNGKPSLKGGCCGKTK